MPRKNPLLFSKVEIGSVRLLNMDLERLKKLQEELSNRVVLKDYIEIDELRYVAGVDQAFIKRGERESKPRPTILLINTCAAVSFFVPL